MNLVQFSFLVFLFMSSCASLGERSPAQDSSVFNKMTSLLDMFLETQDQTYEILRYPLTSISDIRVGEEIKTEVYQLFEDINLLDDYFYTFDEGNSSLEKFNSIRQQMLSHYSFEQRMDLLQFCFRARKAGEFVNLGRLVGFPGCEHGLFYDQAELERALKDFPALPEGVRYDGQAGWHEYDNKDLLAKVRLLTLEINHNKENFIETFDRLSDEEKEKFRHNSHGRFPENKVEPIDLLASYSTWYVISKNGGQTYEAGPLNKIFVAKLVQKSMSRLFQLFERDPETEQLPTMSVQKKEENVVLWCAKGRFKSRDSENLQGVGYLYNSYGTDLIEGMDLDMDLSEFLGSGRKGFVFHCNTMEYKVVIDKVEVEPINPPQEIDYTDRKEIHALVTVALVDELGAQALFLGKKYLQFFQGWKPVADRKNVDTEKEFKDLFSKTDLFIPVSHAMDVNRFDVTTKKSRLMVFKKTLKKEDGEERDLIVTLLLPESEGKYVMNPDSLSELLLERRKNNLQNLFLMNTSCHSKGTLFTWIMTYRKSLEKLKAQGLLENFSDDHRMPHVVGSNNGFDTETLSVLLSHMTYPSKAMEMLTLGKSVRDVVDYLGGPKEESFADRLMNYENYIRSFGDRFVRKNNQEEHYDVHSTDNFMPDYIGDHPELLRIGGYTLRVDRRGFEAHREY